MIKKKISLAYNLLKVGMMRKRAPIIVSWLLTYRCERKCLYCDSWKIKTPELDTHRIMSIIDEISEAGVQRLHFTGGDPLLREDIGIILDYCRKRNLSVDINSNGSSVMKKISEIDSVDILSLSLDGPEEIHDLIRGKGSYRETIEAAQVARKQGIKIKFTTVLSKYNLNSINFVFKKANELKIPVMFQPARLLTLAGTEKNSIAPEENQYKSATKIIIEEKKRNKYIINSASGLNHLYSWPRPTKINCINATIICCLHPNGDMYGCGTNLHSSGKIPNCLELGFRESFNRLIPLTCRDCWCASFVELSYIFSFNPETLKSFVYSTLIR